MATEEKPQSMQGIYPKINSTLPFYCLSSFLSFFLSCIFSFFSIESWVTVEGSSQGGLTHVKSTEEVTQLLAEAVNEEKKTVQPVMEFEQQEHSQGYHQYVINY